MLPQAQASRERMRIVAQPATLRELPQFFGAATAQYDLVGVNSGHESFHDVHDMSAPPLFSERFHTASSDVPLIGASLVGQMAKLHRNHHSIGNYRRPKTGP